MPQSNNESNVRGMPSFWQNHTVDPPIPWEEWSDLFQLAITAKEKVDIKNSLNPIERYYPDPPALENRTEKESENQRKERLVQKRYDDEEAASIRTVAKGFKGMRIEEADKKLRSTLHLALENERKKSSDKNFFQRVL